MRQGVLLVNLATSAGSMTVEEVAINDQLSRVNEELDRYTCKANMFDYALAVASGAMAGAIDVLYVGDTSLFWQKDFNATSAFSSGMWGEAAGYSNSRDSHFDPKLASLNELLRRALEFAQERGLLTDVSKDINHRLALMSRQPTPQGLAASILIQMLRLATQVVVVANRDGQPMAAYLDQTKHLLIPAAIVGFLNWLKAVSRQQPMRQELGETEEGSKSRALVELALAVSRSKTFTSLVEGANAWFDKRMRETLQLSRKPKKGYDVAAVLLSLLRYVGNIPNVGSSDCLVAVGRCEKLLGDSGNPYTLRGLTKQAVPALLNEVIVRTGYLVTHLTGAFSNDGSDQAINWVDAIPVGNRTVDRMMTIASMALMAVDTKDAAGRASVEAAAAATEIVAYGVIYAQRFVARFNYVAAGRAVISVAREMSDEAREAQLLHEKRVLSEARAVLTVERLEEFKAQLADQLDGFLVEHLTAFYEGLSLIDQGLANGSSDLVIAGNVTIQRVLGREAQFTNQGEFDALMESNDDFVF